MNPARIAELERLRSPVPGRPALNMVFRQSFLCKIDHRDRLDSVLRMGDIVQHFVYDNTGLDEADEAVGAGDPIILDELRALAGDLQNLAADLSDLPQEAEAGGITLKEAALALAAPHWVQRIRAIADEIFAAIQPVSTLAQASSPPEVSSTDPTRQTEKGSTP